VFAVGRFVAMEEGVAVFALPNSAHVEHATPLVDEVAAVISRQVGAKVGLRLIAEQDSVPPIDGGVRTPAADGLAVGRPSESEGGSEPSAESSAASMRAAAMARVAAESSAAAEAEPADDEPELDDLAPGAVAGRHDSASWAEGRLLEAFPGAEEVP
jgi:hypothetical protein